MYESFLENVSLLKHLEVNECCPIILFFGWADLYFQNSAPISNQMFFQKYERENIADALVSQAFAKGQEVVKQASHHKPD